MTTTLYFNEEKKHSVRYDADKKDDEAVMSSAYISKTFLSKPYPKVITVTVEVVE